MTTPTSGASGRVVSAFAGLRPLLKVGLVVLGFTLLMIQTARWTPSGSLGIQPWALLGALLLNQIALFLAADRFRATLAAFGIAIGLRRANVIHLQSTFYYFFVPMSVGLEVARFAKVRATWPDASPSKLLAALLVDRFAGMLGMLLIAVVLVWPVVPNLDRRFWFGVLAVAFAGVAILTVVVVSSRRIRRRLVELRAALMTLRARVFRILALSCGAQMLVCGSVVCLFAASAIDVDSRFIFFTLSAGGLAFAIPASFLGVSFADAASAALFRMFALDPATALALTSAAFGGRLVAALQGGIIEAFETIGSWRRDAAAGQAK